MKLTLFSTVERNILILTNKNVIQMAKRIQWTKKLKVSLGLIQQLSLGQNFYTVTTNLSFLRQKTKQVIIRVKTLKFRLKSFMGTVLVIFKTLHVKNESNINVRGFLGAWYKMSLYHTFYNKISDKLIKTR